VFGIRKNAITAGLANFLFSIDVYMFMTNNITGVTREKGPAYPSGAHELSPFLMGSCCLMINFKCSVLKVFVCSFGHWSVLL
jgi:hypothetical protein